MNFNSCLVFDIGSSSIKAGLFFSNNLNNPIVYRSEYEFKNTWIHTWESSFFAVIKMFQSTHGDALKMVTSIVIGGNGPSLVSVDGDGLPIIDVIRWSDIPSDFRGGESYLLPFFKTAYSKLKSSFLESKLKWFLSPAEYFTFRLSRSAACFSPRTALNPFFWNPKDSKMALFLPYLPPFKPWGSQVGSLTASGSLYSTLPEGVKLLSGAPDYALALLGAGATKSGIVCDRTGTSEGINFVFDEADLDSPVCKELNELGATIMPHPIKRLVNFSFVYNTGFTTDNIDTKAEMWKRWGDISRRENLKWSICGGLAQEDELNAIKRNYLGESVEYQIIPYAELVGAAMLCFKDS